MELCILPTASPLMCRGPGFVLYDHLKSATISLVFAVVQSQVVGGAPGQQVL